MTSKMLAKRKKNIIKKPGRPTDYSSLIVSEICEQLSEGKSLRSICKAKRLPSCSTIFLWLSKYPEFSEQYARAREEQADAIADECLDIAETEPDVQRARLKIDVRKWCASKMKPRKYGDRITQEHTGLGGGPIQNTWVVNPIKPEEVLVETLDER